MVLSIGHHECSAANCSPLGSKLKRITASVGHMQRPDGTKESGKPTTEHRTSGVQVVLPILCGPFFGFLLLWVFFLGILLLFLLACFFFLEMYVKRVCMNATMIKLSGAKLESPATLVAPDHGREVLHCILFRLHSQGMKSRLLRSIAAATEYPR